MNKIAIGVLCALVLGCMGFGADSAEFAAKKKETVAFVEEAKSYIDKVGKAEAYKEFQNAHGKFMRGDQYIFAFTKQGKGLVHPVKPTVYVGVDASGMKDPKGKLYMQAMMKAATSPEGKGWVEYAWGNPKTKTVDSKIAYILSVDKDDFIAASFFIPKD